MIFAVWTLTTSLSMLPAPSAAAPYQEPAETPVEQPATPPEPATPEERVARLLDDAGRSVPKLWEVHEICESEELKAMANDVLLKIVDVDPNAKRAYELLGWMPVDKTWVPPEEYPNVAKGLYKCGEEWLPIDEANAYHSKPGQGWYLSSPKDQFEIIATTDRALAEAALAWAEFVFPYLAKAYGRAPEVPATLVLFPGSVQYNAFAGGDATLNAPGADGSGYSSIIGAFVAESWFDNRLAVFPRAGVAYWDRSTAATDSWGKIFTRIAAGLGFLEALDPSTRSEMQAVRTAGQGQGVGFWAEKKLPKWFRYGVALYGGCYYYDYMAEDWGGDPYALRNWVIDEKITKKGGLDPLDRVFAFNIAVENLDGSEKLIFEAGLLVAFVLDGQCTPVHNAHAAVKAALRSGEGHLAAFDQLKQALLEHEAELREFAGLPPAAPAAPAEAAAEATGEPATGGEESGGETPQ